jgi:hypothetical protein
VVDLSGGRWLTWLGRRLFCGGAAEVSVVDVCWMNGCWDNANLESSVSEMAHPSFRGAMTGIYTTFYFVGAIPGTFGMCAIFLLFFFLHSI